MRGAPELSKEEERIIANVTKTIATRSALIVAGICMMGGIANGLVAGALDVPPLLKAMFSATGVVATVKFSHWVRDRYRNTKIRELYSQLSRKRDTELNF